jgi:hypothetical protein
MVEEIKAVFWGWGEKIASVILQVDFGKKEEKNRFG